MFTFGTLLVCGVLSWSYCDTPLTIQTKLLNLFNFFFHFFFFFLSSSGLSRFENLIRFKKYFSVGQPLINLTLIKLTFYCTLDSYTYVHILMTVYLFIKLKWS